MTSPYSMYLNGPGYSFYSASSPQFASPFAFTGGYCAPQPIFGGWGQPCGGGGMSDLFGLGMLFAMMQNNGANNQNSANTQNNRPQQRDLIYPIPGKVSYMPQREVIFPTRSNTTRPNFGSQTLNNRTAPTNSAGRTAPSNQPIIITTPSEPDPDAMTDVPTAPKAAKKPAIANTHRKVVHRHTTPKQNTETHEVKTEPKAPAAKKETNPAAKATGASAPKCSTLQLDGTVIPADCP
jgi:hypothetical protein